MVSLDGLKHVSTVSMENVCQTLLEFEMEVDVDIAAIDVREKIDLVRSKFPQDVEDPIIQKFDVNAMPVITLGLTGDAPLDELYDFADNDLKDRLTTIMGVAAVDLVGGVLTMILMPVLYGLFSRRNNRAHRERMFLSKRSDGK